jgi:REP element-mobilizing transposase RayT
MPETPAHFLTFVTYGSRMHGDRRGTVDRHNNVVGEPLVGRDDFRRNYQVRQMRSPAFVIGSSQRAALESAFAEVADVRGWNILALSIRLEHVHVVVVGDASAEAILTTFKAYGTRRLRRDGLVPAHAIVWARHGSTRTLTNESGLAAVVDYVANRQGDLLPGSGPLHQLGRAVE